jgi:hypothetical protein
LEAIVENFYQQTVIVKQSVSPKERALTALCGMSLSFLQQNTALLAWDNWW